MDMFEHPQAADAAALATLHGEHGCTLQVLQPQRWEEKCWRLVAALEAQAGCLVGASLRPGVCLGVLLRVTQCVCCCDLSSSSHVHVHHNTNQGPTPI